MHKAYIKDYNILTGLGTDTQENIDAILNKKTAIKKNRIYNDLFLADLNWSFIDDLFNKEAGDNSFSRFEKIILLSIKNVLKKNHLDFNKKNTLIIISSTKGNVGLIGNNNLDEMEKQKLSLWKSADRINKYFKNPNNPIVICNACISGVLAIILAAQYINLGNYKNVIVCGADILSDFIISGFSSFKSLSKGSCRPFDKNRDGLSLGEGCGTILLSREKGDENGIYVAGGATSNDANHLSGPSRDGSGLAIAIEKAIHYSNISKKQIDSICLHGTATIYNDEMEAASISGLSLEKISAYSLKGNWGHTLGAAGVIESIAAIEAMKNNLIFATTGFSEIGVSKKINVKDKIKYKEKNNICLKTASGFGGCNAGVIFAKDI